MKTTIIIASHRLEVHLSENNQLESCPRQRLNFAFREKLDAMAEGFRHNLCYQCGACVADCPARNYSERFSPRLIMLKALLGFEDELVQPDSEIWDCTNCYTCAERCPQDVRPVDVIIAIKNICNREQKAPPLVNVVSGAVAESGITTKVTSFIERKREELGLGPIGKYPVEEIKKILEVL